MKAYIICTCFVGCETFSLGPKKEHILMKYELRTQHRDDYLDLKKEDAIGR
jgi:hypothetical protein